MKKNTMTKTIRITLILMALLAAMLSGCGREKEPAAVTAPPAPVATPEPVSAADPAEMPEGEAVFADEQALTAVRNYCFAVNPDLKDIVKAEDYPAYWELASSDAQQIVVLFRSYTGAQVRYYVDRQTGETYVTEFVPGITDEEQRTDETFNVRNYL